MFGNLPTLLRPNQLAPGDQTVRSDSEATGLLRHSGAWLATGSFTCLDESSRPLTLAASAALVPPPAALDGEGTFGQDLLPLTLQQIQL